MGDVLFILTLFYFFRTQEHRDKTLAAFKEGSMPVLVSTDVPSRLALVVSLDSFSLSFFSVVLM